MERINKLLKNFLQAGSGNIVGQILMFLIVAYLGRVLGPKGYGVFNFAQAYLFYFYILTDLGLSLYCIKQANQVENSTRVFQDIFTLRFYLSIFSTILFFLSIFFIDKSPAEKNTLYLMGLSIFFNGIFIDSFFTAKNNMKYIGVSQFLKNALFYLICLLLVHEKTDVGKASIAFSVGFFVSSAYLILRFKKVYSFKLLIKPSKNLIQILKTAFPLAFSLLMIQVNNNFDIIYLSFVKDQSLVGYYSAAYKIINFLIAVLVIYFNASYGTIAELFKKDRKELNKFITNFYKIGILFVAPITLGGIVLSNQLMVFVYGNSFKESGILFALLVPLILIRMVTSTYTGVLIMADKSKQLSFSVAIGALINIVLNIIFVPRFGAVGSAVATLVCEIIQGAFLYLYYKNICSTNLIKFTIKPVISSMLMALVIWTLHLNLYFSLIIGIVIYFIFVLLLDFKQVVFLLKRKIS